MMNENFAIEWENIEYALNESELIALNELQTAPTYKLGALGTAAMMPTYAIYKTGTGAAKMAVNSVKNWDPSQAGKKSVLGITKTAGIVARSPLAKIPFWQRLIAKLKEIWQKFKNVMSALFRTNQGFVNKELYNAEAIINNALAQDAVDGKQQNLDISFKDVKPYWNGERYFNQISLPPFNPNDKRMLESLADLNQFVANYLRGLTNLDFNDGDCINKLTYYLSGGDSVDVNLYDLVPYIKNLISYCTDMDSVINQLEKEQTDLERAGQEAINAIQQGGVVQETTNSGAFDANIEANKADNIIDTVTRIKNYIKCVSIISGVKKSIVRDRFNQSINILREVLKKCRPATKEQIQNTEVSNKTKVIEQSSKDEQPKKEYKDNWLGKKMEERDTRKKVTERPTKKGLLEITDDSLMKSLPNNAKKLQKRAEKVNSEREAIVQFIKKKKIRESDPRFQPLWDQVQEYSKHLAVIEKKMNDLENEKGN